MDNESPSNPLVSVHVPVALVALALTALFWSQITGATQASKNITWQTSNADKQIVALKENREKLTKAIEERKTNVATAEQTQKQFTDLMKELDKLARTGDKDAKQIIDGYGIKVEGSLNPSDKKDDGKAPEPAKKDDKAK